MDVNLSGQISLSEWLCSLKANAEKAPDATKKMLSDYDAYLLRSNNGIDMM